MSKKLAIITIGYDCQISKFVKYYLGLHVFSSPFEWNITKDVKTVIDIINHNFDNFITENIILEKHPNPMYQNTGTEWGYSNQYGIGLVHDTIPYIKNGIRFINKKEVVEKYKRRIQRFYNIFREADLIIIIRGEHGFNIDNYVTKDPTTTKNLAILK